MSEYGCGPNFWTTGELVFWAKKSCKVETPTDELTDPEIKRLVRWIALFVFDIQGEILANTEAVQLMVFITLCEFPDYYERYGLSPDN